ncbi:MFS transporter [Marinibacterium sp. SX1]|uniref:MFS transporter n=1 Tax=Marinibacterium sp. SX1 TaxID=3388424 RepID=UPI003D163BEC
MSLHNRWLVLAVISSALLLIVIDMTVLYTALPRITADLSATPSEKLWIVNAYALTMAGLLPASGALGDRFGPRVMFLGGLLVFTAASLVAALAPTAEVLIAGRVLLAFGAAAMMPATFAILRHTFDDPAERNLAIGIWAAVASGGAAFGPVLGGVLLEFFWWGSVFLVNVPIGLAGVVLARRLIAARPGGAGHPFSLLGSLQIMIGLVAVTVAIKELGKPAPSLPLALGGVVLGGAFIALFIRGQLRARQPMLDLRMFANPAFSGAVLAALFSSAALTGLSLAMTQRFQLVMGLSPLQAGLVLAPLPLASFVAGPVAGRLLARGDCTRFMIAGLGLIALGLGVYMAGLHSWPVQIAAMAVIGAGIGTAMTSASAAIMQSATDDTAGTAASVEEVSYELGGALGVTIFGSILAAVYTRSFTAPEIPAQAGQMGQAAQGIDQALSLAARMTSQASARLVEAAGQAFDLSFMAVLVTACALLAMAAGLVAVMNRRRG